MNPTRLLSYAHPHLQLRWRRRPRPARLLQAGVDTVEGPAGHRPAGALPAAQPVGAHRFRPPRHLGSRPAVPAAARGPVPHQ